MKISNLYGIIKSSLTTKHKYKTTISIECTLQKILKVSKTSESAGVIVFSVDINILT